MSPGPALWHSVLVSVRRILTDLPSRAPAESQEFYRRVLGLEPVMDLGWIVNLADPVRPGSVSAC